MKRPTYVVQKGDSLYKIARRFIPKSGGSGWVTLYRLNRDVIYNPDLIEPGLVLRLPYRSRKFIKKLDI